MRWGWPFFSAHRRLTRVMSCCGRGASAASPALMLRSCSSGWRQRSSASALSSVPSGCSVSALPKGLSMRRLHDDPPGLAAADGRRRPRRLALPLFALGQHRKKHDTRPSRRDQRRQLDSGSAVPVPGSLRRFLRGQSRYPSLYWPRPRAFFCHFCRRGSPAPAGGLAALRISSGRAGFGTANAVCL